MAKKISQLTQATQVKSDDVTVIVQDGETKKLPLNMMVTKQDIENKKVAGLAKLDEIEATYENDTYTPTIAVKNKSSVKVGEGDGVDYSANVMDGHVKSAILKGQTLVNLLNDYNNGQYRSSLVGETDFVTFFNMNDKKVYFDTAHENGSYKRSFIVEPHSIYTMQLSPQEKFRLINLNGGHGWTSENYAECKVVMLKGDYTNVDIPYFTGMQSVKMPVLTTYNLKRIIDFGNITYTTPSTRKVKVTLSENTVTVTDISNTSWTRADSEKIQLESNEKYTIAYDIEQHSDNTEFGTRILDSTGNAISVGDNKKTYTFTTPSDGIIKVSFYANLTNVINKKVVTYKNINLVKGTTAKPLTESFKSNILTVNEDVELGSVGEVKDELDLLTGKITQRTDIRPYQEGDESNSEVLTDMTNTRYKLAQEVVKTVDLMPSGTHPSTTPYCWKNGHIQLSSSGLLPNLEYSVVTSRAGQINQNATMIVKNDKRIFDLEILLAGGLVNTTYQALTLQNQVETGLSKVSLSSEKEPDYLLYHMIMKLIEEKAYKLDDLTEKVSVFYLYEKLSDEQFETIYSALYPFVEDEIIEEPVVEELPEVVEDEVIM